MSKKLTHKHRRYTVYLLVFIFVSPIVASHLLYHYKEHFQFKTLHTGQLLSPPLSPDALPFYKATLLGKWQLVHVSKYNAITCESSCKASDPLSKIHLALGKEKHRVEIRDISFQKVPPKLTQGNIAIIDPQGWLIMVYPTAADPQGILKDLKRLLRYSHAG